jgi:DNA gyrase subunit B
MSEDNNGSENGYDSSSIQVLEGLAAVRKRPGMYIGSTSSRGLHHLVYEVVDNSVDEALAGYCTTIKVHIHKDNSITVIDNGRGIPTDTMPEYGMSALQVVLTKLHAGGKFSKSSYKVSGGLHGVGVSVVNALSEAFIATVWRDGKEYVQEFARGDIIGDLQERDIEDEKSGTMIWFLPDKQIFTETEYDYDILSARLRELAFLNSGLRIVLFDERTERNEEYMYEGGIQKFVEYINEGKQPLHDVVRINAEQHDIIIDMAMQYNHSYTENLHSFVNNINTIEGGTHLTGFKSAITRALNNYLQRNMAKEAKNGQLTGNDVREGLTAVISIKIAEPQFEGQTKTKLGNSEVKGAVDSITFSKLVQIFDEQPQIARRIIEKCLQSARAREAAARARELVRRKSVLESSTLPGKLADCSTKDKMKAELYVVEGDSAGGCFSADTRIALLDGRNISFKQIIEEQSNGIRHYCYTIREGRIDIGEVMYPRITKSNAKVITIILDNGERIKCTPDHLFMIRDGTYKKAGELTKQDSLMPLYRQNSRIGKRITIEDYEMVYEPSEFRWIFTHMIVDDYNIRIGEYVMESGEHRHHKDFNKKNNNPDNITRLPKEQHLELHRVHAHRTRFFDGSEDKMSMAVMHYNHKIASIINEGEVMDVYDIEVPGTHNFALASGVFVHNSAKQARDREFQAILPLRGKILNVEKSHISKAIKNKEIQSLITAIGTSVGEDFNIEKIRYGKIIIMTDADVDGAHIRTLLLTFFFRYMRELIEAGHIYIAQPPLYKVQKGRKAVYVHSDEELKKTLALPGMEGAGIQRYKGLGEMNPQQLWETTMDPQDRSLLQVNVEDAMLADKLFTTLMGIEVEPRRAFIETHALEVQNLDL